MKILFIYPTRLNSDGQPVKYKKAFLPPLSLAILDSLTPPHHYVEVVNEFVENIDFSASYDLVGITAMTSQIGRAYQIADTFRERGTRVIIGGIHPTVLPLEAKQHADSVVIGEADDLWETILDDFQYNNLRDFYRSSFSDLERSVIPKWDHMDMSIYPRRFGARLPLMPIFTTRGCPYGCKFCSVTKFFGKTYRVKPISKVLQEIESTGATEYFFVDDNIACRPDYSRELFRALHGKGINWVSHISTTVLKHPDLLELAGKAGCTNLIIGMESINQASPEAVNKGVNKVEEFEELIARMRKAGIIPLPSFIFGFDEDTQEEFDLTLEFVKKHRLHSFFQILTPFPGTEIYTEMEDQGNIKNLDWSLFDFTNVLFQPYNFSRQGLIDVYWETYQGVYTFKNIILSTLNDVMTVKKRPLRQFFKSFFYKTYYRRKVRSFDNPLSSGIGRVQSNGHEKQASVHKRLFPPIFSSDKNFNPPSQSEGVINS